MLESLAPPERLAFVLHDMFAVPFTDIAPIVGRTPAAARQLASRARRRVQGSAPVPDPDLARQRQVVDAFLAVARSGDFEALVAVLDPDVVLRADTGAAAGLLVIRGAAAVARQAISFRRARYLMRPALVNGTFGMINLANGQPVSVTSATITNGKVAEIYILADPERIRQLDLTMIGD